LKPLSFVIITYNRAQDLLELLRNISGLDRASDLLEEVIVVNNASTDDYGAVKGYMTSNTAIPFRYFDAPENLGVARGRNFALQLGKAPYVIMLDDDALMGNHDCLVNLQEEFLKPRGERELAIISFRVLYYSNNEMQVNAFPHKDFEKRKDMDFFLTYYYAGGAHAIRRSVLEKTGNYPIDFFYGMEEYDLSYRILDAGYSIIYSNRITMLHKESPLGRNTKKEKMAMLWINKSKVAWRYLPKKYFYSTSLLWSAEYLKITGFHLSGWIMGWLEVRQIPKTERRKTVSQATMDYLRQVNARLTY
jgi:GT2 family glycosyltransferase